MKVGRRPFAGVSAGRLGVLSILGGAAGGQVLALVCAPLLSRMYTPTDFGILTIVLALASTTGTVASLRYEMAIPLPERESEAHSLATLGLLAVCATTLLTFVVVGFARNGVAALVSQPGIAPWLWFVPALAASIATFTVLNQLAIRHARFTSIGRRNLLQSVVTVLGQLALGLAALRPLGLLLGVTLGQAAGAASMVRGAGLRSDGARLGRRVPQLRAAASRYRRFPLVLAVSGLLNTLGLQAPVLVVSHHFGPVVTGWLGMTQRVLTLPVTLLGVAVAQVYLSELARAVRTDPDNAVALFRRTSRRLLVIAVPVGVGMVLIGPWAFSLVFGGEWLQSGVYAQALAIGLAAQLVAVPVSSTLTVYERQTLQLSWDAGRLVLVTAAVAAAAAWGASALTTMWVLGVGLALTYVASWLLSRAVVNSARRPTHDADALGG